MNAVSGWVEPGIARPLMMPRVSFWTLLSGMRPSSRRVRGGARACGLPDLGCVDGADLRAAAAADSVVRDRGALLRRGDALRGSDGCRLALPGHYCLLMNGSRSHS